MGSRNKILKKCLSMILSLILVLTMMPMVPGVAQKASAAVGRPDLESSISSVEATSNISELLGYNNPYELPSFTVETGSPAYFDEEGTSAKWQKINSRGEFADYKNSYFTDGLYCYTCEVRIPEAAVEAGFEWALPLTITVDGTEWTVATPDSNAVVKVYSQLYSVEKPDAELTFNHSDSYDIKKAHVDKPIDSFSVVEAVSGGTAPYTFTKVSGPEWINVSAEGIISGTPVAKGENDNLIVRVRDSENAYRDIEIYVENTSEEDDGRTIIGKVVVTSNIDEMLGYGKSYTRGDTTFSTTSGSPAYLFSNESNGDWERLVDGEWVQYRDSTFVEGTYHFDSQVRIDGNAGATYKLSEKISVTVDGRPWSIGKVYNYSSYSLASVTSPEYIIEKPEQVPLVFSDNENLDVKTPYVGREIPSFTLSNQVSGGVAPYTFSKVIGPNWITVSANGVVSGTPTAIGEAQDLVVRVTDGASEYKEITIGIGETILHNDDKTVVSTIVADSNIDEMLVYGNSYISGDTKFNVTVGEPAYFNANEINGEWQKKLVDDTWVKYEESVFLEGTYRFSCQIRIDGEAGKTHIVKADTLAVTVDGKGWTIGSDLDGKDFSLVGVISPEYVIEKPVAIPLMFADSSEFDIGETFVGIPIEVFSVASAVTGGTTPYTFSKTTGPEWLVVAEDGTISGTPDEVCNGDAAVIRVTDADESYKEIKINLGRTYPNPASRTAVTTIVASSDIDVAIGGPVTLPTITITEGTQARFVISETNGKWYVKNGEDWELYTASNFEAGTYRFECPIKIDGGAGKSYILADSVSITVDGKTWTAKAAPVITNTSSTVDVYSAEYVIDETKYGIITQTDGNGAMSASASSAEKDTIITLQTIANAGFMFAGWQITPDTVVITDNQFAMPEGSVTVKALFKPLISKQPTDAIVKAGDAAIFNIGSVASSVSCLWQHRASETDEWVTAIGNSGYTTNKLTVNATSELDGYQYRCVVTDNNGNEVYSNVATLFVDKKDITDAIVELDAESYSYDGTAKKPSVIVKDGDKTLVNGTDYEVTYSNNIDAGTATVTIEGKGDYTGTITEPFIINPVDAETCNITQSYTKKNYTGSTIAAPSVTVKDADGNVLTKGTDYDVSGLEGKTSVGRYMVTVTFKGNYEGTKTLYYTIVPKAPTSASAYLTYYWGQYAGYDDVKFTWSKVTGASGYLVYYKRTTASSYTYLTSTTNTYVRAKNFTDGVGYYFKVVPYYKSGDTKYTSLSYKTATVYTLKQLNAPTLSKSSKKVKVKWNNINGETGYQISKSTKKSGTNVVATYATTSGTYKTVSATKGKTYYYKVRAYKTIDGKKIYGPWSSVKSYKRK